MHAAVSDSRNVALTRDKGVHAYAKIRIKGIQPLPRLPQAKHSTPIAFLAHIKIIEADGEIVITG
jgi:hypothetical protein